jgi:3-hydroxyisobutyrate dehydrogenase-like beta-hydroxyacid dehydrogenase
VVKNGQATESKCMPQITLVKKVLADGKLCKKCIELIHKLEASENMKFINNTVIAVENDPDSEGMILAKKFAVDKAPFFIFENKKGEAKTLLTYSDFIREALYQTPDRAEEVKDFFNNSSDMDFL